MPEGSTAKNDFVAAVASKPDSPLAPLDSLLSPKGPTYDELSPRGSVAESDYNDIILDDDPSFSTVSLSGNTSLVSEADAVDTLSKLNRRTTISSAPLKAFSSLRHFAHKKSASTVTIPSAPGSSILARIGSQGTRDEGDIDALRSAGEGQQKLHEEFLRLHNQRRAEATESEQGAIDWGFWGAVISDYQGFAASNPQRLAKAIEKGIPDALRGMMWQLMAASKDIELENTYLSLLKESSPHEKAITRDLGRTFPHHDFFTDGQGIGQEHLFNVLKAYSLYDPQVGYCQGLPFVVAVLLLNMPDEEAFSLLVRLMHSYDLRGHFLPEMPKLQLRLYQFDRLIEDLLPVLHVHFLRQGIKSSMFCSQWFLTLFSYRFPLEIVVRIYDNCLASGIEAIFAFSIVLLQKNEDILLTLKFDDILAFIKNRIFERYEVEPVNPQEDRINGPPKNVKYHVDAFVVDAISMKITPFMLDTYAHEYDDLVRARDAHATEIDTLRNNNRSLSAQVKELDTNMAQLNAEHVEVLNQLVMARLRNEELEEELVKYKLLYAEVMHQKEDAMSSHRLSNPLGSRRGSNHS
ncbi:rab-GTPase-TBC domain-containing protein [Suillus paluster]|uniref:rab-GTPase-TBC domain-containing protein n=1 Tax=Suillus paluster TaxID=48578 RepID=UPI001B86CFB4|nr:rab-GTPase-TBC domain-containing protein [Suillus paluster]KAG1751548.1 rab-GTPase-TBC domain-containing protein [Suillus paluster]